MNNKDVEILKTLVDRIVELSERPVEEEKKRLWADHQGMIRHSKIPITVFYEGIPGPQWKYMLGEDFLKCESSLAKSVEFDLRRRIWVAENVPDDHIIWKMITVGAVAKKSAGWGVDIKWEGTKQGVNDPLEAKKIIPVFEKDIDLNRLKFTDVEFDDDETELVCEQAKELVGEKLEVRVSYGDLGYSPFDVAVELCGIENIMYFVIDIPEKVHALMDYILESFEKHHKTREKNGHINAVNMGQYFIHGFRVNCRHLASSFYSRRPLLSDESAYVSAQQASGLSPAMFAEFVQPYNCRLAKYFTKKTVYYHGCENLDEKIDVIAGLPNLRRFHVSPWSSVEVARNKFKGSVILEVHSHPGEVFFGFTKEDMRKNIEGLIEKADGHPMDLNLSDIHSINGKPELLTAWAQTAQDVVSGR